MRKWKCVSTNYDNFTVGNIYETDNNGVGAMYDNGTKDCGIIWNFTNTKFEEVKDFTLADLKPCMVVIRRDTSICGVFQLENMLKLQEDLTSANCCIDDYESDLKSKNGSPFDIMKVYDFPLGRFDISINNRKLLWERIEKSPTQIKLEELETKQREIADEMAQLRKEME